MQASNPEYVIILEYFFGIMIFSNSSSFFYQTRNIFEIRGVLSTSSLKININILFITSLKVKKEIFSVIPTTAWKLFEINIPDTTSGSNPNIIF